MALTLRLPAALDERLRAQAYLERRPMSELIADAVERDLPRLETKNGHLRQLELETGRTDG